MYVYRELVRQTDRNRAGHLVLVLLECDSWKTTDRRQLMPHLYLWLGVSVVRTQALRGVQAVESTETGTRLRIFPCTRGPRSDLLALPFRRVITEGVLDLLPRERITRVLRNRRLRQRITHRRSTTMRQPTPTRWLTLTRRRTHRLRNTGILRSGRCHAIRRSRTPSDQQHDHANQHGASTPTHLKKPLPPPKPAPHHRPARSFRFPTNSSAMS